MHDDLLSLLGGRQSPYQSQLLVLSNVNVFIQWADNIFNWCSKNQSKQKKQKSGAACVLITLSLRAPKQGP